MKYEHIIWDFDGTLFNTYPAMAAAFSRTLSEYGIDESVRAIKSYMKVSAGYAKQHYKKLYSLEDSFFERYEILQEITKLRMQSHLTGYTKMAARIIRKLLHYGR